MKQVLQSLNSGEIILEKVPCPKNTAGSLLIETTYTLVSSGTERMLLAFGKANVFGKIKQQPEKVKMVLEKIKTHGLLSAYQSVQAKLDQPIPLGYCQVGRVIDMGEGVSGYSVGDRVISNGSHAEIVRVPKNLCAKIPETVSDEEAAFTVVSAIALQGIRLSQPTLGECYVVFGLGLIGLLAAQLLTAQGCRVLGVDPDKTKWAYAKEWGVETTTPENIISHAEFFSNGLGVDAVIITAATKSNALLHQAAMICRKRARIILVGVIGNEFSRADFYEKELTFQVSCSYGPGRYDARYEKMGLDYPIGFVRWTEQRNFEAILALMADRRLQVEKLISHRFSIDDVAAAYDVLENNAQTLGILLHYPARTLLQKTEKIVLLHHASHAASVCVGFIGAGNYSASVLAPAFQKTNAALQCVASSQGVSAKRVAKKWGFSYAISDEDFIYRDDRINTVVIATPHHCHAKQVIVALEKNKHVFVEKPLAISLSELENIKAAYDNAPTSLLMIGFNRRFSPFIKTIKKLLSEVVAPKSMIMTVNAGQLPKTHWAHDPEIGGGRIIGEACHFIDLMRYLAGCDIKSWKAIASDVDAVMILLEFTDHSCATIHYLSNGSAAVSKERLEIFCDGKILQLDNFRKLVGFGFRHFKKQKSMVQNKGQIDCVQAFVNAIQQGMSSPISFDEVFEVSKVTIEIAEYLRG